ncbi:uncharacterized protein LOC111695664 [Eurytemora carolleeae]|uniref:uncharacterized protein LOC111695664 n=1 Tax=Eurytemora carolleeae TaxID=1294199 RepID=UPI000C760648|nr:uncharacterized protein LOC111695664 [Eurytemora carolleeae]|eukprot:XP_023320831.1 uncharacterized protein LOC111695664 [Eurytemora affinis]
MVKRVISQRKMPVVDVCVVVVGDPGVGKSQLINRFLNNQFSQEYTVWGTREFKKTAIVGCSLIRYRILDTSGGLEYNSSRYPLADVFIICYRRTAAQNAGLQTKINKLRQYNRAAFIILAACQVDRSEGAASKPVTSEDAVMFVETSAKFSQKSVLIAFEVAAMACLTHTQNNNEEYTCSKQVQLKGKISVADIHASYIQDRIEETSEKSEDDENAIYTAIPYINSDRDSYTTKKSSLSRVSMASSVKSISSSEICSSENSEDKSSVISMKCSSTTPTPQSTISSTSSLPIIVIQEFEDKENLGANDIAQSALEADLEREFDLGVHHGGSLRPVTGTSAKQYSRVKTSRGINVSYTDSGVMYTQIERKGCLKNLQDTSESRNQGLYGGLAGRSTKENTNKWMRASNYELDSIQVVEEDMNGLRSRSFPCLHVSDSEQVLKPKKSLRLQDKNLRLSGHFSSLSSLTSIVSSHRGRRQEKGVEKTVKILCERMTEQRILEEVEIEIPELIFKEFNLGQRSNCREQKIEEKRLPGELKNIIKFFLKPRCKQSSSRSEQRTCL